MAISEPKASTKPKAEPKAETMARAKAEAKANSTPKPFRVVDRTGGNWEVSNRVGSWRQSKMMEADVQGVSQATTVAVALQNTMAVGSTPAPVCGGGATRSTNKGNSSVKQTLSRRTCPRNNRRCSKLHMMRTTEQDGDEDRFESTEVSA